jgi:glutamate receptor, ionotropic, invertebrate
LVVFWWLFALIVFAVYALNLPTYLTVHQLAFPVNSVDDLAKQTDVEYGVLRHSSAMEFFRRSKITVYARMWEFMSSHPDVFVDKIDEGIRKVRNSKGKYAFIMDTTTADYRNERKPCDTTKVGQQLGTFGNGVATPLGSPLKNSVNLAILHFLENGDFTKLHNKWWLDRSECSAPLPGYMTGPLSNIPKRFIYGFENSGIAGCFFLLAVGLVLAIIIALIEKCCNSKCKRGRVNTKEEFGSASP